MATRGKCPDCGAVLLIPENLPGGKVRCARCEAVIDITKDDWLMPITEADLITTTPEESRAREKVVDWKQREEEPRPSKWDDEDEDEDWLSRLRRRQPDRAAALAKVRTPATILQILGVFYILAGLGLLGFIATAENDEERMVITILSLIGMVLTVALGVITIIGGTRMKALRSHGLALTSVILTFVVAFLICQPLALAGIWPVVVLMDANVKANFDKPAKEAWDQ